MRSSAIPGCPISRSCIPTTGPRPGNSVRRQVSLRRRFQLVYRIVSRQGQVRWVWEQGKGVFSSSGEILALEGFITVIAEEGEDEIAWAACVLLRDRQLSS